ncbi:MAG: hypothetical protein M3406_10200 [Chloroflexota bacterium]|nr:hypothetical protein [Chloroflexota bacterium]
MTSRRRWLSALVGVAISAAALRVVASTVDLPETGSIFADADLVPLVAIVGIVAVRVTVRAWSWSFLMPTTLASTAAIVAPTLLHDLSHYPAGAKSTGMLVAWPPAYVLAVGAGILVSLRLATQGTGWLGSATTDALTLPRFIIYDGSYLIFGLANGVQGARGRGREAGRG